MADAEAVANDSWFDDVTSCIPASASNQQNAEVKEHFKLKDDDVLFNEPSKAYVIGDASDDFCAKRGFYDTDIVMIEAKHNGTVRLGSGVLMKDMKSWVAAVSENEEKRYRFVITAAHVVCSAQWDGVEIYDCIRVRIPLKPWPEFPENWKRYQGGYKERKDFFSNIIVKRKHIFVHPNYEGKWHDIAMIAIPEVIATHNAKGFKLWNSQKPTSFAVVGFPMATKHDGETVSHIPYVSARKQHKNGIAKIEFKKMKTMMAKYYCFTRSGMSGGAIILDGCIAGIHNRKDELEENCGHGLIFDSEVKLWMNCVAGKWDVDLGIHDNSAERFALHGREISGGILTGTSCSLLATTAGYTRTASAEEGSSRCSHRTALPEAAWADRRSATRRARKSRSASRGCASSSAPPRSAGSSTSRTRGMGAGEIALKVAEAAVAPMVVPVVAPVVVVGGIIYGIIEYTRRPSRSKDNE